MSKLLKCICIMSSVVYILAGCGGGSGGGGTSGGGSSNLSITAPNSNAINSFYLHKVGVATLVEGNIDQTNHVINVEMPYGTDLTKLVANFVTSGNVFIGNVSQTSDSTVNNFAKTLVYTVTGADAAISYNVIVRTAAITAKEITQFALFGQISSSIDPITHLITIIVPANTDITKLDAVFSTNGQSVTVDGQTEVGNPPHDFTTPHVYAITAQDGTIASYTVTVTKVSYGLHGVNYDPAHNANWTGYQIKGGVSGQTGMTQIIDNDLQQMSSAGFTRIKTYYSQYCNFQGSGCVSIAAEACKYKMHIALGVFEFAPANGGQRSWTTNQVNAAINAVNSQGAQCAHTIVAIVVGVEDLNQQDGNGNTVGQDIVTDITTIRDALSGKAPPLGTAQTTVDLLNPGSGAATLNNIVAVSDFVGADIYPFWGDATSSGTAAANMIYPNYVGSLQQAFPSTVVLVAEEGWPSQGNGAYSIPQVTTPTGSQMSQNNYYNTWSKRDDAANKFDSFYFSMYDKIPITSDPIGSPDNYFGLCSVNNLTKGTFPCPPLL